jgi:dinuclear metal center YbgI/SA1388 family protein
MVPRYDVIKFINELLQSESFHDACPNGLQVCGKESIAKIATCPSVSLAFFKKAVDANADLLLVHHGLFWKGDPQVIHPVMRNRLKILFEHDLNLLAYHIPLDANRSFGNNAALADLLDLQDRDWHFGMYNQKPIGVCGIIQKSMPWVEIAQRFVAPLACQPHVYDFCRKEIKKIGIVCGGGGSIPMVQESAEKGCDGLITGSISEQTMAIAREMEIGLMALGHYNSEKLGVRALGEEISRCFDLEIFHVDVFNPI